MSSPCSHARDLAKLPDIDVVGCESCLEMGDTWVNLRRCMSCGRVGCCDSSKNKHASAHAKSQGHPVVRSAQPGESWWYCFEHDAGWDEG